MQPFVTKAVQIGQLAQVIKLNNFRFYFINIQERNKEKHIYLKYYFKNTDPQVGWYYKLNCYDQI